MTRSILDVLVALGAREVREGQLSLDLSLLSMDGADIPSLFGGPLAGTAMIEVSSPEAFAFHRPPELAACGTLWLPGVEREEDLARAILDAHDTIRSRLADDQASLRRLGLTPRLVAPEPRAVASLEHARHKVQVCVDDNGDLVVTSVDGREVPPEHGRVMAVDGASGDARAQAGAVVDALLRDDLLLSAEEPPDDEDIDVEVDDPASDAWDDEDSVTRTAHSVKVPRPPKDGPPHLSDEQMAELAAALDDDDVDADGDDDDDDDADHGDIIDASDEGTAVNARVERPVRDDDDEPDPTLSVPAMKKVAAVTASPSMRSAQHSERGMDAEEEEGASTVALSIRKPPSLLDMLDADPPDDSGVDEHALGDGIVDDDEDDGEPVTATSVRVPPAMGPSEEEAAALAALVEVDDDGDDAPTVSAALQRPVVVAKPAAKPADPDASDQIDQVPMPPPTSVAAPHGLSDDPTRALNTGATGEAGDLDTAASELRVDDFPALPADSAEADAGPTSVTRPGPLLSVPSETARPTLGLSRARRTSDDEVEAVAGGFDDGEGAELVRRARGLPTEHSGSPVVTAAIPTKATVSQPEEMPDDAGPSLAGSGEEDELSDVFGSDAHDSAAGGAGPEEEAPDEEAPVTAPLPRGAAAVPARGDLDGSLADAFDDDPVDVSQSTDEPPRAPVMTSTLDMGPKRPSAGVAAASPPSDPALDGATRAELDRAAFATFNDDDDGGVKTRAVFVGSTSPVRALRAELDAAAAQREPGSSRITGPNPPVGLSDSLDGPDTGPDVDAESLDARADALEEEARVLRARAHAIRLRRAAAVAEAAAELAPPLITAGGEQERSLVSAASLPVLASMDVHEVQETSQPSPQASEAASSTSLEVDVDVSEPQEPDLPTRVPVIPGRASDEGVSLAAVQAALEAAAEARVGEMVAEATQVGALREGQFTNIRSSSGDEVFESANASRPPEAAARGRRAAPSEEAPPTRVREVDGIDEVRAAAAPPAEMSVEHRRDQHPAFDVAESDADSFDGSSDVDAHAPREGGLTPGAIGLIVEDAKARDRLRKHLEPRFKQLVEAESARAAADLPELRDLDALVFVRPRPDEQTREGIQHLCDTAGPGGTPRILVISSDARFDEIPRVLRRPLGQRASEVAQSVLDGLRELGVEALDASSEGG